jgi:hypothetical protein
MKISEQLSLSGLRLLLVRPFLVWWYRHYRGLFFFGFMVTLLVGGSLWYYNIHHYVWTDDQEKAYLSETYKETDFKSEDFDRLVRDLKAREEARQAGFHPPRDLFRP